MTIAFLQNLFRWRASRETGVALFAGMVVLGLSAVMIPLAHWPWARIAVRDIGQILLAGILFPLVFIQRSGNEWAGFGLTLKRWPIFLSVNLVLGILLFLMFLSGSPPPANFQLDSLTLWSAAYVMLALFFELVFFYAFLRTLFERAFGIVPAVILAALFYAFHHIGFQPEYGKLVLVGLLYAITYRLGNSALLIFPFFLGVGGTYDVLVQSQKVSPILSPQIRTLYLGVLILAAVGYVFRKTRKHQQGLFQHPARVARSGWRPTSD
jgi:membrane protease YdiL (CAAX protease family)